MSNSLWPCGLYPDPSLHEISQARILERVAISFSRGFSWPKDWTCNNRWILYLWAIWEAWKVWGGLFLLTEEILTDKIRAPKNGSRKGILVKHKVSWAKANKKIVRTVTQSISIGNAAADWLPVNVGEGFAAVVSVSHNKKDNMGIEKRELRINGSNFRIQHWKVFSHVKEVQHVIRRQCFLGRKLRVLRNTQNGESQDFYFIHEILPSLPWWRGGSHPTLKLLSYMFKKKKKRC